MKRFVALILAVCMSLSLLSPVVTITRSPLVLLVASPLPASLLAETPPPRP